MSNAFANPISSADWVALKLYVHSPNRNADVVSSVNRKNSGCRSMLFLLLRIQAIKSSRCSRSMLRFWYCCRANWGRSISLECFQAAPSCVKIPSPSKGKNIWRRSQQSHLLEGHEKGCSCTAEARREHGLEILWINCTKRRCSQEFLLQGVPNILKMKQE